MRRRLLLGLTVLCALVVAVTMPTLAWYESRRQAQEAAAELALGYALDVLHRSDETSQQAQRAIGLLEKAGHPPCSAAELALMRQLDLTSTYLQAVGHVVDGRMLCSSMGAFVFDLGPEAFRTARGAIAYLDVPLGEPGKSPLIALQRGRYAVLIHRDLPLDTSTGIPGVALGVFQTERPADRDAELARGQVSRAWVARLGRRAQASFVDGGHLVAVARSIRFEIAAVAAIPLTYVDERAQAIGARLVPAGVVAGLALAAAIGLLAKQQRSLAGALRYALRRGEFFLQYQPIVALDSGRCVGVEALLRWRRATGELVGPDIFIPVAEQSGLMPQLTRRVLQLVEADVGRFLAEHPDFHIALNLSAADLLTSAISEALDGFMARSGARPSNIILEITERGFLDMDAARPVIAALRMRRLEIAIDDFGTGYSSLSYLESLALDFLKIDRSFIEAIGTRAPTSQVVGHIIAMARTMGLRMIAEGVERREQADFLAMQGVQYAQGWLYGRPASFGEVVARHREAAGQAAAG